MTDDQKREEEAAAALRVFNDWLPIVVLSMLAIVLISLGTEVQADRVCGYGRDLPSSPAQLIQ